MTPAEARRKALIAFGGPAQISELSREARGWRALETTAADVRYAWRQLIRRPGLAALAITTLALGIGATTLVLALADSALIRPLPFGDSDRLYSLYEVNRRGNIGRTRTAPLNLFDWQVQARSFDGMAAHIGTGFTFTGKGDAAFVLGQVVTPNLFRVLRVQPLLGRALRDEEAEAGHHLVAVLSYQLWMRRFGGDRSVINTSVTINGQPYLIAGVMPSEFQYPAANYELWVPLVTRGELPGAPPMSRGARYLRVVGRLAPGVAERTARSELDVIGATLAKTYPDDDADVTIGMTTLRQELVGDDARNSLVMLLVAVGIVWLVACVNVAGLTLARGSTRTREVAVRAAIGASRPRLVRQFLTENFLLYALAAIVGLVAARASLAAVTAALPATFPRVNAIAIDWRVAASASMAAVVTGLLFSLLPALATASRRITSDTLGTARVVSPAAGTLRVRGALIVAQIAAAIVLLGGASLALRSFVRLQHTDLGFDPRQTMTFRFVMPERRYPSGDSIRAFVAKATEGLTGLPMVSAAGLTTHLPLADNNFENAFTVDGSPNAESANPPIAGVRGVSGDYRAAIAARLLSGRDLGSADGPTTQPVAVVTESFAKRHVHRSDPIGVRIKMGGSDSSDPWRTIVGVIDDVHHVSVDQAPRPEVWLPFSQLPDDLLVRWLRGAGAAIRTRADPQAIVPELRAGMRMLDAAIPLVDVEPLEDLAHESVAERRVETWILGGFAAGTALLAAIGLFGVLAFYLSQHVQEFGIRLALGATPPQLMWLVARRGLILFAAGVVVGVPATILLGREMKSLLYETAPTDPAAILGAVALIALVTFLACAWPARRAMRIDPAVALRQP
jgi:predicted permease